MLEKLKKYKFIVGIIFIGLIYIVLTSVQNPVFYYLAGYDDLYILASAMFMLDFDWFGPFTASTLTKGPGAPLFIAISNCLGLSLTQAQFLLYLGAVILLVCVLKKVIKNDFIRLIIFTVVLFNPIIYSTQLLRVYRDNIYSSFLIYVIAFAFGIFFNYKEKVTKILPYMIGFGIFTTWMAITREETIWISPFIIGSFVITSLFIIFDKNCLNKVKKILLYLIPIGMYLITIFIICLLNKIAYGEFIRIENKSSSYKKFIKAVSSVDVEKPILSVPLPKEAREKLYEVSPSFAELKDYLENNEDFIIQGKVDGEIEEGWLLWAIVSAVHEKEYDKDLKTLNNYFDKVTNEVNQAFKEGKLKKEDNPASIFDKENFELFLENIKKAFYFQVEFRNVDIKNDIDTEYLENPEVEQERRDVFVEITGNTSTNSKTYNYKLDKIKLNCLIGISKLYKILSKPVFIIGIIIYILIILKFFLIKPRFENYKELIILTSFIMLFFIRLVVIGYTETKMCPAINTMYLSSTYSLMFCFEILSLILGINGFLKLIKEGFYGRKIKKT